MPKTLRGHRGPLTIYFIIVHILIYYALYHRFLGTYDAYGTSLQPYILRPKFTVIFSSIGICTHSLECEVPCAKYHTKNPLVIGNTHKPVSRKVFGHNRSKSQCFQVQPVFVFYCFGLSFLMQGTFGRSLLQWWVVFLKSTTSTGYFSNSTGSFGTTLIMIFSV